MGKYGFRSGYVNSVNIKEGSLTFGSSDTSSTVSFDDPLREDRDGYSINLTPTSAPDGDIWIGARSCNGFTIERGSTGSEVTYEYTVIDQDQ